MVCDQEGASHIASSFSESILSTKDSPAPACLSTLSAVLESSPLIAISSIVVMPSVLDAIRRRDLKRDSYFLFYICPHLLILRRFPVEDGVLNY